MKHEALPRNSSANRRVQLSSARDIQAHAFLDDIAISDDPDKAITAR